MKVLIIGGAGLVGRKLAARLAARGQLRGREISAMVLGDIVDPVVPAAGFPVGTARLDIADRASVDAVIDADTDVIFLLAAVVSAHAEADLDAGLATNLHGVFNVLERVRALGSCPVLVFTSSIAVFGGEVADPMTDATHLNPQTSYGTQKAMGELLVNDYSRRGLVDGRTFRLPTISVRPGAPNRAASAFMSGIIREPLAGTEATCPVGRDFAHYYLSPRRCVENLVVGAEVEGERLGANREDDAGAHLDDRPDAGRDDDGGGTGAGGAGALRRPARHPRHRLRLARRVPT
ncbi:MAG: NAD-dependent epimerase/dehydratase family protein, partial [Pseudomonadota bacterium]